MNSHFLLKVHPIRASDEMAIRKSPRLNGPAAKVRKVDGEASDVAAIADAATTDAATSDAAIADAAAIEKPTLTIFDLIEDCCYAILDYLAYTDLRSFALTCKWAQRLASDFYKLNYSGNECGIDPSRSTYNVSGEDVFNLENVQQLRILDQRKIGSYRPIAKYCHQVRQISFSKIQLSAAKVRCLQNVLRTVEYVQLNYCTIAGDFHENFLQYCEKIQVLYIQFHHRRNKNVIGGNNSWLTRRYPTLERLVLFDPYARQTGRSAIKSKNAVQIDELQTFLEQNPNVRHFAMESKFIEGNLDFFKTSDIKLDTLAIRLDTANLANFCDKLNALHERGIFERLNLLSFGASDEKIPLNMLEKFTVNHWMVQDHTTVSQLVTIKQLNIHSHDDSSTMKLIAQHLVNLECVNLGRSTAETILPLVRYGAKLKRIKIFSLPFSNVLDLAAWNKEREKLVWARKVIIYVPESIFLATKWAGTTDFTLIKLKRKNAFDTGDLVF